MSSSFFAPYVALLIPAQLELPFGLILMSEGILLHLGIWCYKTSLGMLMGMFP